MYIYLEKKLLIFGRIMAIENLNKHLILALIYMAREKKRKRAATCVGRCTWGGVDSRFGPQKPIKEEGVEEELSPSHKPFFHW
jgi:hypothetical protein